MTSGVKVRERAQTNVPVMCVLDFTAKLTVNPKQNSR